MQQTAIIEKLHKHFPGLAEKGLQLEIAQVGKLMSFETGEIIMDFGSYIKIIPLVTQGTVKVLREEDDGREIFLYYLMPGQTCAVSFTCCMMNKKSEFRTVAEEDTEIIGIPVRYMDEWMSRYQSWKNFVMMTYDERFKELVKSLDSIVFKKMDDRLLDYLHKKAEATGSPILKSTHQEIAYDLNASREAVSRLLKALENEGIVRLGRNQVEVLS